MRGWTGDILAPKGPENQGAGAEIEPSARTGTMELVGAGPDAAERKASSCDGRDDQLDRLDSALLTSGSSDRGRLSFFRFASFLQSFDTKQAGHWLKNDDRCDGNFTREIPGKASKP